MDEYRRLVASSDRLRAAGTVMVVLAVLVGLAGVAATGFWALRAADVKHGDRLAGPVFVAIGSAFATVLVVTLLLIIAFGAQTAARAALLRPLGSQAFGSAYPEAPIMSDGPVMEPATHSMPKVPPRVTGIAKASAERFVRSRI